MDKLKPRTTKYAINVCSTVIYIVIYIVFDILSDIIMLLCIEELLLKENNEIGVIIIYHM